MRKTKVLLWMLLIPITLSIVLTGCKKKTTVSCPTVVYTQLDKAITDAQTLYKGAVEGTNPGQYVSGSKATFKTAIDLASSVRGTNCVTQKQLDAAVVALNAATSAFKAQKITDVAPGALVAHWLFNGNAKDATGNGHDGVPTIGHAHWGAGPAPQLTTDRFGKANDAYHFDKGSDIVVPYSSSLNPSAITISLWVKMEERPNNDYIISLDRWNGWKLNLQSSDYLFFTVKAVTSAGDTVYYDRDSKPKSVDSLKWTAIAVSFENGKMNFYVNGALVKAWTNTPGTPVTVNNVPLSIGSDLPTGTYSTSNKSPYYVNWGGFFKGDIDDVRLYNVALTGAQVQALYAYEKNNTITK